MKRLLPLTPEELAAAEDRLLHPRPGSRIEAAQRYGVDLTLLVSQLRRTPEERLEQMQQAASSVVDLRQAFRRRPRA